MATRRKTKQQRYVPESDYDETLPFGGKVVLAKKKKPESWIITILEVGVFLSVVCLLYYSYFYFDYVHFHVTHMYAHMGHSHAQHAIGHKYLNGAGVKRNHTAAFEWFRKAADQGHAHSAYNLAVGHMQGYRTDVKKGNTTFIVAQLKKFLRPDAFLREGVLNTSKRREAQELIQYAANEGVPEAHHILHTVCSKGHCKH